jgi:uncharacterized protein DUF4407
LEAEKRKDTINTILWNLGGFKKSVITQCKVDEYHAKIIGLMLILVGVYATIAWFFFFQTVSHSVVISLIAGLFMGFFIVSFDRALIASLSSGKTKVYGLIFRLLLAILLGVFLSQPIILKLYQPEIMREVQILSDKKVQERQSELEKIHQLELNNFKTQKDVLQTQLNDKLALLTVAESDFKKEMDGTGGTGRWGYSTVSKLKEKILERHREEYKNLQARNGPQMDSLQSKIEAINNNMAVAMNDYQKNNATFGTLIQAEALGSLISKEGANSLKMRYYLLVVILTLIELSALISKMLFKMPSYKSKVSLISDEEVTTNEDTKEIALAKLAEYKIQILEKDVNLYRKFFESSKEINNKKVSDLTSEWQSEKQSSFKDYWTKFKERLIISS